MFIGFGRKVDVSYPYQFLYLWGPKIVAVCLTSYFIKHILHLFIYTVFSQQKLLPLVEVSDSLPLALAVFSLEYFAIWDD